jgi:hypothetical protein
MRAYGTIFLIACAMVLLAFGIYSFVKYEDNKWYANDTATQARFEGDKTIKKSFPGPAARFQFVSAKRSESLGHDAWEIAYKAPWGEKVCVYTSYTQDYGNITLLKRFCNRNNT